ncbi:MAG TPA: asparaginase [Variovorax sp.]|nr:asparaginase [Variovorax sp.]
MIDQKASGERRVLVLGTGGTIAGRAASGGDNIGYVAGQVGVAELLAGIEAPPGVALEAEQVAQVDSKDMEYSIWCALARRCAQALADPAVAGIVVTHGTDTLEETAFFLHSVLAASKPVVLTCAMRPASALSPDGPQNVRDAIAVAATPDAHGVSVVCAGVVHGAVDVQKVHTYRLDAFGSGDGGPLGFVEEGQMRLTKPWPAVGPEVAAVYDWAQDMDPPRVEIVFSHAGARGALIDSLVAQRTGGEAGAVRGLVLAATGNGTLHREIEQAAARAQAAGVRVVRATRCSQGRILAKPGDSIPDAGALSPVKARVWLQLALLAGEGR